MVTNREKNYKQSDELNIDFLNGWIKTPQEASEEMDIPINEVLENYGSNFKIAQENILLIPEVA